MARSPTAIGVCWGVKETVWQVIVWIFILTAVYASFLQFFIYLDKWNWEGVMQKTLNKSVME